MVMLAATAPVALAQDRGFLGLDVGEGALLRLEAPAATVFVAHPDVADVQIAGPRTIFLFGQAPGRTTFFALDSDGGPLMQRAITVTRDLGPLRALLASRFPNAGVRLSAGPGSIMVEGAAASALEAEAIADTVAAALGEGERVINRMSVDAPVQVNLRVRVAEVSRNIDQRLGFNWQSLFDIGSFSFFLFTGRPIGGPIVSGENFGAIGGALSRGDADVNALIDALDREGFARTLAEPNLTALSGETASFTAGGEFPIPVAQDGDTITVEFKQFGVILDFTPTVLSNDRISLRVRPEVSDISTANSLQLDNIVIPGLSVRRVETTVELASGQGLVIGGLLQQSTRDNVDKLPGLGDVPVLGSLFTSTRYLNNETELLVTVTPYVVRPTRPDNLPAPVRGPGVGQSLEALLAARSTGDVAPAVPAAAGFTY
jgi:pilus assembly protein CpaC